MNTGKPFDLKLKLFLVVYKDWQEFLELLNKYEIEYLIVGAHAMSAYGYSRHTGDIDVWVKPDDVNAIKLKDVLMEFGFSSLGLTIDDLKAPNVIQLGYEPLRIDILKEISGVSFEEAYPNRKEVQIESLLLPVISLKDLIQNKQSTDRPKDRNDVEMLNRLRKNRK